MSQNDRWLPLRSSALGIGSAHVFRDFAAWISDLQRAEAAPVEPAITGQQALALDDRVRTDDEVRDHSGSRSAATNSSVDRPRPSEPKTASTGPRSGNLAAISFPSSTSKSRIVPGTSVPLPNQYASRRHQPRRRKQAHVVLRGGTSSSWTCRSDAGAVCHLPRQVANGPLVYRFRINMRLDGASPVAGNKRTSCCGAVRPRPGHAEATPGRFAICHVNSQTDH